MPFFALFYVVSSDFTVDIFEKFNVFYRFQSR